MAAELFDLRAKVTALGHCALAAHCRAHDIDKSELVRDIVEVWARRQAHGASMLASCMKAKGVTAADAGIVGNPGESLEWDET
jgi:hypothetical protein